MSILAKIFGDSNKRYLKKIQPIVDRINSFEKEFGSFSNDRLKEKTEEFKKIVVKENSSEILDEILPEAFALVREAAKRTLNQRHFDVQLIGGIVLQQGKIAEMKTGEGKTLTATLPLYLNALEGKGCHLVTVNDYLAKRDTVWMGQIYHALGISVGCIVHDNSYIYDPNYKININEDINKDKIRDELGGFKVIEDYLRPVSRKEAYSADITYGTNNEFGFDYLKDNMAYDLDQIMQREFNYAIVDEVDSILIDEARTPLIISMPETSLMSEKEWREEKERYYLIARIAEQLQKDIDYIIDEKQKSFEWTKNGQDRFVELLGEDPWKEEGSEKNLYSEIRPKNFLRKIENAIKAKEFFLLDRDYVIKNGEIIIVDEFTGRLMPGRRWSGGLHQANEAKEHIRGKAVDVMPESRTLASITFQNYFRMYKKLAGMTGTAITSAEEFDKVYKLDTIVIPTHKPMIRVDLPDKIYKTSEAKFKAVVNEIRERYKKGQPVLVGTVSIEKNEYLSKMLEREGIPHNVLNAKNHEKEGEIIAQAGRFKAVTIATNMAGRGVDIILGGNPCNLEEAEKVKQLGGLYVIGTERHEARRIDNQLRGRAGRQGDPGSTQFFVSLEDDLIRIFGGEKIKHLMDALKISDDQPIESKMVTRAIESAQSKVEGSNFDLRKHILEYDDVMNKHREVFYKKRREILEKLKTENPDDENSLKSYILNIIKKFNYSERDYNNREKELGQEMMRQLEKFVCIRVLDDLWIEHLENMEYLRDSVYLRAYGQKDPLVEYKSEGHKMFKQLLEAIELNIVNLIFKSEFRPQKRIEFKEKSDEDGIFKNVGRNDPCPCGAKKPDGTPVKFKHCHGK